MNIEDLIAQYIDGDLPGEAESELHHRLAVSPEARKLFRAQIALHGVAQDARVLHRPTVKMRADLFERLQQEEGMEEIAAIVPSVARAAEQPRSIPSDNVTSTATATARRRRRLVPMLLPFLIGVIATGVVFWALNTGGPASQPQMASSIVIDSDQHEGSASSNSASSEAPISPLEKETFSDATPSTERSASTDRAASGKMNGPAVADNGLSESSPRPMMSQRSRKQSVGRLKGEYDVNDQADFMGTKESAVVRSANGGSSGGYSSVITSSGDGAGGDLVMKLSPPPPTTSVGTLAANSAIPSDADLVTVEKKAEKPSRRDDIAIGRRSLSETSKLAQIKSQLASAPSQESLSQPEPALQEEAESHEKSVSMATAPLAVAPMAAGGSASDDRVSENVQSGEMAVAQAQLLSSWTVPDSTSGVTVAVEPTRADALSIPEEKRHGFALMAGLQQNLVVGIGGNEVQPQSSVKLGAEFGGGMHQLYGMVSRSTFRQTTSVQTFALAADSQGKFNQVDPRNASGKSVTSNAEQELWGGLGYRFNAKFAKHWSAGGGVWAGAGENYVRIGAELPIGYQIIDQVRVELLPTLQYMRAYGDTRSVESQTRVTNVGNGSGLGTTAEEVETTTGLQNERQVQAGVGIGISIIIP
jgi:hypothetical protein